MRKLNLVSVFIVTCAFYVFYVFYLRQGGVSNIYQQSQYNDIWGKTCKSTVVVVDNAPLSRISLKRMWLRFSEGIINDWAPLNNYCDSILFIDNKLRTPYDKSELDYWMGDDYYCLKGKLNNDQCLPKESQIFVIQLRTSTEDDEKVGVVGDKNIYIHFIKYGG
ncbi:hypothetical protein EHJ11_08965 [Cronobacter turicensis]|uniref:hypothetical protein n=1 Tax=Cronobacter turicensis TaxID=413502 RepID=UPI0013754413|nr:hypothetical protein [Cronobacter turicensis]NCH62965.1 hypothetical protein [Cronobacter turicensis]